MKAKDNLSELHWSVRIVHTVKERNTIISEEMFGLVAYLGHYAACLESFVSSETLMKQERTVTKS